MAETGFFACRPRERFSDDQLIREYRERMRDCFGRMFGRNARLAQDEIARELFARGIREIPNLFGPIAIVDTWSKSLA